MVITLEFLILPKFEICALCALQVLWGFFFISIFQRIYILFSYPLGLARPRKKCWTYWEKKRNPWPPRFAAFNWRQSSEYIPLDATYYQPTTNLNRLENQDYCHQLLFKPFVRSMAPLASSLFPTKLHPFPCSLQPDVILSSTGRGQLKTLSFAFNTWKSNKQNFETYEKKEPELNALKL